MNFKFTICLTIICLIIVNGEEFKKRVKRIVGGSPAELPPEDDPLIFLQFAGKSASIRGVREFPHYVFRGIRYAQPPTGRDRFQRPRQYLLSGDYNATRYAPPCAQTIPNSQKVIGSEDCLFLNVFTPDMPDGTEGLPVVVWIHGGGFRYGSASQYGVRHLVGKRLVMVTIQYRLGTLGFLSSGTPELPGNAALWDMALAVQWTRNYIGFFGGNPHKIVIMGQGTGASGALLLALSNIAKGSASAIVAMSGSALSNWAMDNNPKATAIEVAQHHGCPITNIVTMIKCLQALPPDNIIQGDDQLAAVRIRTRGFVTGLSGLLGTAPNAEGRHDGRFLPPLIESQPIQELTVGNLPKIPLLTGITKDETKKACHGKYQEEIKSKLKTIPNFLDKVLVQNLQSLTPLGSSENTNATKLFNILDPLNFRNYLKVTKNNLREGVEKISEITSDALFNLPAFLTADLWSKNGARTFLYRFEHLGKARKGRYFLQGLPLVGNVTSDLADIVGHGDELSYIFEARNLDGTLIKEEENLTDEDVKVRDFFTQMIADFARNGKISVDNVNLPSFSSKDNNFVQVTAKPKVANNFRYCEMALWAGLAQRLQSSTCQFLNVLDSSLKGAQNLFYDIVSDPQKPIVQLNTGMKKTEETLTSALKNPLGLLSKPNKGQGNKNPLAGILG